MEDNDPKKPRDQGGRVVLRAAAVVVSVVASYYLSSVAGIDPRDWIADLAMMMVHLSAHGLLFP